MNRNAPTTKKDFYPRWKNLEFGNRIRMWSGQAELLASDFRGTVTARSMLPGGQCVYRVPVREAATNATYAAMTFNESAPDDLLAMQGELFLDVGGYALYCSTEQLPMRKALASSGVQYYGLAALGRLKHYCNDNGYQMLMDLLEKYPEAVVEFSCYSVCLGEMSDNNVVTWEVRNY